LSAIEDISALNFTTQVNTFFNHAIDQTMAEIHQSHTSKAANPSA